MEAEIQVLNVFLSQGEWYGIPRGYNISYRIVNSGLRGHRGRGGRDSARMSTQQPPSTQLHSISIEDPTKNSFVLDGLEEFTLYEVLLQVSWEKLVIISSNLAFTSHLKYTKSIILSTYFKKTPYFFSTGVSSFLPHF